MLAALSVWDDAPKAASWNLWHAKCWLGRDLLLSGHLDLLHSLGSLLGYLDSLVWGLCLPNNNLHFNFIRQV